MGRSVTFADRMNSKDLDMMTSTWTSLNGEGSLVNIVEDQKGSELSGSFDVRVGGSGSWGTIAHDATAADVKDVKNVLEALSGVLEECAPSTLSGDTANVIIERDTMGRPFLSISGMPTTLVVQPAVVDLSTTVVCGKGFRAAEAGQKARFTIQAKDLHGNVREDHQGRSLFAVDVCHTSSYAASSCHAGLVSYIGGEVKLTASNTSLRSRELYGCSEPSEPGHISRGSTDRDHFYGFLQQWALRSYLRWNDHGHAGLGY